MTKEKSLELTSYIAKMIASGNAQVSYTESEVEQAKATYSEEKLSALAKKGFYFGDFELFFVLLRFCDKVGLWKKADEEYLKKLFLEAKRFQTKEFLQNPYLKQIKTKEKRLGNFLLTEAQYERGEFFQYDMPALADDIVVPKLGFFDDVTPFAAVYEGVIPWVSVCPSEIFSMEKDVPAATGRVLVLGLGLGYYPFRVAQNEEVESITIVEKSPEIIKLFQENLLPQFPNKEKIRVVEEDAFRFLSETENGEYDFCYADIWEGWVDGAACYEKILPHEKRLTDCRFRYWIQDEIRWFQKNR